MDLREKPGKVQKAMEFLLRIRLISLVVLVVAAVSFVATGMQNMISLPLAASDAFGMWMSSVDGVAGAWASSQFLIVAAVAAAVLCFVFAGARGGIAAVISFALSAGALVVLGGDETMPLMMFGILAAVSLVGVLFVKLSVACGLFPFVIAWAFFCGLCAALPAVLQPTWLVWAVLSALGFAGAMALSAAAGKQLAAGTPQAGALVKAAKQMVVPMVAASLLAVCAIAFDMGAAAEGVEEAAKAAGAVKSSNGWLGAALYFVAFNVWFFGLMFPVMSFGPWERLRSGSRRVEMKEKKKPAKGSSKK